MSGEHGYALRAPWYVRARRYGPDLRDARSLRPEIQKYDSPGFVDRLLADPADSLTYDETTDTAPSDDVCSFLLPVPLSHRGRGRARLATHKKVPTTLRKLYQPSHQRFYVVVVELFCDEPGLPRPGDTPGLDVKFVVRRRTTTVHGDDAQVQKLARDLVVSLLKGKPDCVPDATGLDLDQANDLLWADDAERERFEADHAELLEAVTAETCEQAWMVNRERGEWRAVGTPAEDKLKDAEQELPMWRLPDSSFACEAARTRSLWFGVVPTYSADKDVAGVPKLDEHAIYEIRCFARVPLPPGHEHCTPRISWSRPTRPFRLAAFFDPDGTKNHSVTIKGPDFRALEARAGQPAGPGGVRIESPPASQLQFDPDNGSPSNPSIGGGEVCTFALELFMIVAMFVFSLFLPVVVFLFQLWWLLALRFCAPLPSESFTALEQYFDGGGKPGKLPLRDPDPKKPDEEKLDAVLGARGSAAHIANDPDLRADPTMTADLVAASDPGQAAQGAASLSEESPPDPLCHRG